MFHSFLISALASRPRGINAGGINIGTHTVERVSKARMQTTRGATIPNIMKETFLTSSK
jgi:hypothetical protein